MKTKFRRRIVTTSDNGSKRCTRIKSLTRDDGTQWEQSVDKVTGQKTCSCPGFKFRGRCKHLERVAGVCERHGEEVEGCMKCHTTEGLYELADEAGQRIRGAWICARCAKTSTASQCRRDRTVACSAASIEAGLAEA